jgi:hypothetical protein
LSYYGLKTVQVLHNSRGYDSWVWDIALWENQRCKACRRRQRQGHGLADTLRSNSFNTDMAKGCICCIGCRPRQHDSFELPGELAGGWQCPGVQGRADIVSSLISENVQRNYGLGNGGNNNLSRIHQSRCCDINLTVTCA